MTRHKIIRTALTALAHGRRALAVMILEYCVYELNIPAERLVGLLVRRFKVPQGVVEETLFDLNFLTVN